MTADCQRTVRIPPHGENVFRWERTEIEEAFKPLDPKNTHGAAMTYSNVATQWDQGLETFARSVQGSIAEAWEGSAADKGQRCDQSQRHQRPRADSTDHPDVQ